MTDLHKCAFSMLGQKQKFFKIDIVKHFAEMLFHKVEVYVSPVEHEFIKEVCFII